MFSSSTGVTLITTYLSDFGGSIQTPLVTILAIMAGLTVLGFIWRKSKKVTGKKF